MLFSSRKEYKSEKNGMIIVDKFLWYTNIVVKGCLEAGTYLIDMWKDAIKKLPKYFIPKNVLLLGLGGGNIIHILQKKYPNIKITVIEWDEVMVGIAKDLKLFSLNQNVKISNRDAYEAIQNMSDKFDLIIVDLFTGPTPPEFLGKEETVLNLKKLLKQDGQMFLNVYRHVNYISNFQEHLSTKKVWKFRLNTLALFSNEQKIPDDFVDMKQSENFLRGSFRFGEILKGEVLGVRHSRARFAIEYFTSDKEPTFLSFRGLRLVIWDRIKNDLIPNGWHQMLPGFRLCTSVVSDISEEEYWKTWSETARRYRLKWETQMEYEIINLDLNTFTEYYLKLGRPKDTRQSVVNSLTNRVDLKKESISFFGLRHKETGEIFAGIATVDAPEISQSYYLSAFLDKENGPAQSGLWLMNHWFIHCKKNAIKYANFGPVWTPGQSKSWKGFTEFKSHFRPFTLRYQRPLFRFTFSLKKETGEQINEIAPE